MQNLVWGARVFCSVIILFCFVFLFLFIARSKFEPESIYHIFQDFSFKIICFEVGTSPQTSSESCKSAVDADAHHQIIHISKMDVQPSGILMYFGFDV